MVDKATNCKVSFFFSPHLEFITASGIVPKEKSPIFCMVGITTVGA